jgi:hypothetical protein
MRRRAAASDSESVRSGLGTAMRSVATDLDMLPFAFSAPGTPNVQQHI